MLDGYNRRHAVSHIRSGKIRVLFFQNSEFTGVLIHNRRKGCLKTCKMSAALRIVDIVAEAKYIFMELVDILEYRFHLDAFRLSFIVNRFMQRFFFTVQVPDKSRDSFRLMINNCFRRFLSPVFKTNRQLRIQIRSLMQSAFYFLRAETCFFKNLVVRKKIDFCPCLFRLSDFGQKTVFQLHRRHASFISVVMDIAVLADFYVHIRGERVHDR